MKTLKTLFTLCLLHIASMTALADHVSHVYHFNQPVFTEQNSYQLMGFQGCELHGQPGKPTLPWQSVRLMLPPGQEAVGIQVKLSDFAEIEGSYQLYPAQPVRPISYEGPVTFVKDEECYRSTESYPSGAFNTLDTQWLHGVAFAFGGFTPVRYVPATGKLCYAQTVTVTVETQPARASHNDPRWLRPQTERSLNRLAQNPEMLQRYERRDETLPTVDMLLITPEQYLDQFSDYIALYTGRGIRVQTISTSEVYNLYEGTDNPEKIRNCIIDHYTQNGLSMVLLGGDVGLVPFRYLWCYAQEDYEDHIPSDYYYAALDGTMNDDNDNRWGEIGEDDLLPELAVARLPFNDSQQLQTLLNKTLSYLTAPVLGEFRKPILAGEHLGDGVYASNDLERLIGTVTFNGYTTHGYPEDYDFVRVYESGTHWWDPEELRNAICAGTQFVNHFGHANTSTVAGWYNWDINPSFFSGVNGVDHNYFIFKSQGCICGDFSDDCILERLMTNSTGAVACIGNSRYGWYSQSGDGPSSHFHRELIDAYCHERLAGLGEALKESKTQSAPFIIMDGENGVLRWVLYALNAFGDVGLSAWFDEPFTPTVTCDTLLPVGTDRLPVTVTDAQGRGVYNYECRLFRDGNLAGIAATNEEGVAEIRFKPANNDQQLELFVTGMNGWPQRQTLHFDNNNCAHVLFDTYTLNDPDGQVDYGEQQRLNVGFRNVGNLPASNLTATLTCQQPEYITLTQSQAQLDNVPAYSTISLDDAFAFLVSDSVPDQTMVTFTLSCTDGSETWESQFEMTLNAPSFTITGITMEEVEGNGNQLADPGETLTLHFTVRNTGHSAAPGTVFSVYCSAPEIQFGQNIFPIGDIQADSEFQADYTLHIDEALQETTSFEFLLNTRSGQYLAWDAYLLNVASLVEDFETGDFSKLDWTFEGEGGWDIVNNGAFEGRYCARTRSMGHGKTAMMSIDYDFVADNEVSFYLKTSTEAGFDFLTFYVDGVRTARWAGETPWTRVSFIIPQGTHTLSWSYEKDGGAVGGQDRVWVDYIALPPQTIVLDAEETKDNTILIYPNPSQGDCFVQLPVESSVSVYNALGQNCMEITDAQGVISIHLEQSGLYFIRIENNSGVTTKKILIQQ